MVMKISLKTQTIVVKSTFFFLILSFSIYASNLVNKSIVCSTRKFKIKGGFIFKSDRTIERHNILYDENTAKRYIKSTSHCYMLINDEYAIYEKDIDQGCGLPNSYIDSKTLEYTMPLENHLLSASCSIYNGGLIKKINDNLNN